MGDTKEKAFPRRLLYLQISFTIVAFLAMAILSYIFMNDIVHGYMIQNAQSVLDFVESQTNSVLQESRTNLSGFSRSVRNMILRGDDIEKIQDYFDDMSAYLFYFEENDVDHHGLFGYLESFPGKPAFVAGFHMDFPPDYDPVERLWYEEAIAANGSIAETLFLNDAISGDTVLIHSLCIYDNEGRRIGIIAQRTSIDVICEPIIETALARGGYGMLVSNNFVILAHPNQDFIGRLLSDPAVPVYIYAGDLLNEKKIFERPVVSYKGEEAVTFFRTLPNNWYVGLVTPKNLYYRGATNMAIILGVLAGVFAAAMVYILIRVDIARNKSDLESKFKSSFLANMSHEIRTPMNAILGITEIQLKNKSLPVDTLEALGKIYNSGDLLLGIINDILDHSKIEAGKMELLPVRYGVASLINDTMSLNMIRYDSKIVDFSLKVNENIPSVLFGDELRIRQILNNLLSNAFKYTKKGEIELSIDAESHEERGKDHKLPDVMLIIRVRDTGLGMTKDQISKLFNRFTRFHTDVSRTIEGTGLGMSITWNLVKMMEGDIIVESTPGTGSVFTVRLRQGNPGTGTLGKNMVENLQQFKQVFAAQKKRTQIVREPMPYGKVLIVDDTESNLYVARGLMLDHRLHIETATSGFEAIEKIKSGYVYDIVFMDHMMPIMDGMEAVNIIRKMGYREPIVALTANAVTGQAEVFLANGFDEFVSKPIDIRHLNILLNRLIRDKQPPEVVEAARRKYSFHKQGKSDSLPFKDIQLIKPFIRDVEKALKTTESLLNKGTLYKEENMAAFTVSIHSIKSALANIGETGLSATARRLELAGRDRNINIIAEDTRTFLKNLRAAVEKYQSIQDDNDSLIKDADKYDSGKNTQVYLQEKLLAVKEACSAFDNKSAEALLRELNQMMWPEVTKEVLDSISGYLLHSEFDEAAGVIERYIE